MSERPERANEEAQQVLQSSELTARLLRRLTLSPGIIDVRNLRHFAARLTVGITRPLSLLDDLIARHGIDDRLTIEHPPLLMEQPWMLNIYAYLTNHHTFSSTTNQFISSVARPQSHPAAPQSHSSTSLSLAPSSLHSSQSSTSSMIFSGRVPGQETNSRIQLDEAKSSALDEIASLPLPDGKFRVSRSPARRGQAKHWPDREKQKQPVDTRDVIRHTGLNPAEDSTASASPLATAGARIEEGEIQEKKVDPAKVIASINTSHPALPLVVAKIRGLKETQQPAEAERPAAPATLAIELELAEPTEGKKTAREKKAKASSHPAAPGRESVPALSSKTDVQTTTSTTALPLVKKQAASLPAQQRLPEFIWRKSADISRMMKESASVISKAGSLQSLNPTAGSASSAPQRQSQTFKTEAARRKDETRARSGISTERILRNISRKLLIERERRGY